MDRIKAGIFLSPSYPSDLANVFYKAFMENNFSAIALILNSGISKDPHFFNKLLGSLFDLIINPVQYSYIDELCKHLENLFSLTNIKQYYTIDQLYKFIEYMIQHSSSDARGAFIEIVTANILCCKKFHLILPLLNYIDESQAKALIHGIFQTSEDFHVILLLSNYLYLLDESHAEALIDCIFKHPHETENVKVCLQLLLEKFPDKIADIGKRFYEDLLKVNVNPLKKWPPESFALVYGFVSKHELATNISEINKSDYPLASLKDQLLDKKNLELTLEEILEKWATDKLNASDIQILLNLDDIPLGNFKSLHGLISCAIKNTNKKTLAADTEATQSKTSLQNSAAARFARAGSYYTALLLEQHELSFANSSSSERATISHEEVKAFYQLQQLDDTYKEASLEQFALAKQYNSAETPKAKQQALAKIAEYEIQKRAIISENNKLKSKFTDKLKSNNLFHGLTHDFLDKDGSAGSHLD